MSSSAARWCVLAAVAFVAQQAGTIDADALPVLAIREELRIGSADDPKLGFNRIVAVDVDRDGQIFVYDAQNREIRVIARDGRHVRTISRSGNGPGEFNRVSAVGVIGDTVWAYDHESRKIHVFRRNGDVISTSTVAGFLGLTFPLHGGAVATVAPQAMRSDGRFISHIEDIIVPGDPSNMMIAAAGRVNNVRASDTVMIPRLLFAPSGTVLDTIGREPVPPPESPLLPPPTSIGPSGRMQYGLYVQVSGKWYSVPYPPPEHYLRTTLSDGSALATRRRATSARPAEFEVVRFDLAGKPAHRLRFRYQPRRYQGAVLDTLAMRPVRNSANPSDAAFKAVRAKMEFPEFQSPLYDIWPANDGSLWLRREDNAGPRHRWIVIERTGTVRGVVEIPRSARPAWARGDALITIDTDADGVPWLVRYRAQRPR